jgi:hypothetical protein
MFLMAIGFLQRHTVPFSDYGDKSDSLFAGLCVIRGLKVGWFG